MPLVLLPFLSSGFVPTDSMSTAIRWFADVPPFTPVIETLRSLLLGTGIGNNAIWAIVWCAGISAMSYLWARRLYNRNARALTCMPAIATGFRDGRERWARDSIPGPSSLSVASRRPVVRSPLHRHELGDLLRSGERPFGHDAEAGCVDLFVDDFRL